MFFLYLHGFINSTKNQQDYQIKDLMNVVFDRFLGVAVASKLRLPHPAYSKKSSNASHRHSAVTATRERAKRLASRRFDALQVHVHQQKIIAVRVYVVNKPHPTFESVIQCASNCRSNVNSFFFNFISRTEFEFEKTSLQEITTTTALVKTASVCSVF